MNRAEENHQISEEIKELTKGLVYRERLRIAQLVARLITLNLQR